MASKELTDELSAIVTSVGGSRRAALLIRSNRGASPVLFRSSIINL